MKARIIATWVVIGLMQAAGGAIALGQESPPPSEPHLGTVIITGDSTPQADGSGGVTINSVAPGQAPPPLIRAQSVQFGFTPRMVKAAYLGVSAMPGDPTLRAQLKLPEGVGLAVVGVDDKGPATPVVHAHDVLYKLDDQLLIDLQQLEVLVRMHKPGDTVQLTVIREAQPLTVSVTLVEKELPELSFMTDQLRRINLTPGAAPYIGQWPIRAQVRAQLVPQAPQPPAAPNP